MSRAETFACTSRLTCEYFATSISSLRYKTTGSGWTHLMTSLMLGTYKLKVNWGKIGLVLASVIAEVFLWDTSLHGRSASPEFCWLLGFCSTTNNLEKSLARLNSKPDSYRLRFQPRTKAAEPRRPNSLRFDGRKPSLPIKIWSALLP